MKKGLKRYVVTMDMYVYARDDKHAMSKANMIADRQDKQYCNQCQVLDIYEMPFGSLISRPILKSEEL